MKKKYKIGFLGYGNMAKAIVAGITDKMFKKNEILLYDPHIDKDKCEYAVAQSIEELFSSSQILVFAVKPQSFRKLDKKLFLLIDSDIVITIMAGISSKTIAKHLNSDKTQVVRVMPNTPCMIGKGMSVIAQNFNLSHQNMEMIVKMFKSLGKVMILNEEKFDIVTAISGSGPAYVEYFMESMIAAGVDKGLTYKEARKLAVQTFIGTSYLVKEKSNEYIEDMIKNVCSPGGTTIEAIKIFDIKDINLSIQRGVRACYEKSVELSSLANED